MWIQVSAPICLSLKVCLGSCSCPKPLSVSFIIPYASKWNNFKQEPEGMSPLEQAAQPLAENNNQTCFNSDSQNGLALCWRQQWPHQALCVRAPVNYRHINAHRKSMSFLPPQSFGCCLSHPAHHPLAVPHHELKWLGLLHPSTHSWADCDSPRLCVPGPGVAVWAPWFWLLVADPPVCASPARWIELGKLWSLLILLHWAGEQSKNMMFLPMFILSLITWVAAKESFFCQNFPAMNACLSFNDFR